jgi:AAA ATPase domain
VELLERDDHLAELDGWLAEVRGSGRGQMVVLGGEAGVGKTAIVRAFGERQRSVAVLAGGARRCSRRGRSDRWSTSGPRSAASWRR